MWLWGSMCADGQLPSGSFHSSGAVLRLAELAVASSLGGHLEALRGRTVLIATRDQLAAAVALIELDGVARRIVLCPPDLAENHFKAVIDTAGAVAWVRDAGVPEHYGAGLELCVTTHPSLVPEALTRRHSEETEWILLTSGTTGAPKLVLHTLTSLTSAIVQQQASRQAPARTPVWSTFYDIRRYGGLQIFLRAALRGGSLVLSEPKESITDFLTRASAAGITHISGTPSHWRRALMSGRAATIDPSYVRLSGEISDQAILDNLKVAFPRAGVAHAFASTEAGVAFEVGDGLAGFPATLVGASGPVELKIEAGTLHIRSAGNATRYLTIKDGNTKDAGTKDGGAQDAGARDGTLRGADGFVDTGDRVELREGRYHFMGRAGGVINVGGLKVHPEEVEAVINTVRWVRMSLVKARRNPITGAVVTAEIVLADDLDAPGERPTAAALTQEIIEACRRSLPAHKVPAMVRIVPSLELSAAGKLVRPSA
jgi:acyl-CoA synthetase (AMP-forming)/AMP-acid ligase II